MTETTAGGRRRRAPVVRNGGTDLAPTLVAVAALAAATGLAWSSTFQGAIVVPTIVGAAVLPAVLVAATASLLPAPIRALLSAGLLVVALSVVLGGPDTAASGLAGAWSDLLTTALPIDAGDPTFALALLVTWLAAAVSAEVVAGTARPLAPVLPPLACLVAALAVGAPGPAVPIGLRAPIAGAAAVLVALRTANLTGSQAARVAREAGEEPVPAPLQPGDRGARRWPAPGRILAAAGVAGAVALAAVAIGPRPPGVDEAQRFDVRRYRHDPVLPRDGANPLAGFAAMVSSPDQEVARVKGGAPGLLLRLAVLDTFDGSTWTSSGRYSRASTLLPSPRVGGAGGDEVTLDVTIADLDGFFLPAPDRPVRVSVDGLGVDLETGILVAPGGGARGLRYKVTSRLPRYTSDELRGAGQSRTGRPLTGLPDVLADQAEGITSDTGSAFGKPAALVRHFQDEGYVALAGADAISGHGYIDLEELFEQRKGTAEQYASAVAVLARSLGYDTRVVVGFRLPAPGSDGFSRVHTGDAHAWAEVRFRSLGWVRFDAVPTGGADGGNGATTPPTTAAAKPTPGSSLPTTVPVTVDPLQSAIGQAPDDPVALPAATNGTARPTGADESGSNPLAWALGLVTGFVVAMGLFLAAVVWAKVSRRRRRRTGNEPSVMVQRAWHEALDRLLEHGVKPERSMSTTEVVQVAGGVVGEAVVAPLEALAALANVARFDSVGASAEQVTTAWQAADQVAAGLRAGCSRTRRLSAAVSPAPLLARRRV